MSNFRFLIGTIIYLTISLVVQSLWADAANDLIRALASPNADIRMRAAEAFRRGPIDARAIQPLIKCLGDKDPRVRREASGALVKEENLDIESLYPYLSYSDWAVRRDAVQLLGMIRNADALHALLPLLEDKDWRVQNSAAIALGNIGNPEAIEPLIAYLRKKSNPDAIYALHELKALRAVETIIFLLKDDSASVRCAAAETLGDFGDLRAVEPLISCLEDKSVNLKKQNLYDVMQQSVAEALGRLGDQKAIKPLKACLKDSDAGLRFYSAQALEKLKYRPKEEHDEVSFLIAKQSWNELEKIGDSAVDPLIAFLNDNSPDIRKMIIITLGRMKSIKSVAPLGSQLTDDIPGVRKAAAEALGNIGKPALQTLYNALPDWDTNAAIISALELNGWQPTKEKERVYFWIGKKAIQNLNHSWDMTKRVLLYDIETGNRKKIENSVYTFMSIGKRAIVQNLIQVLNNKGNKEMAETYLNCGDRELNEAAQSWAIQNGYQIRTGAGTRKASWGHW